MHIAVALCSSITVPEGIAPPWVHLLPAGQVRTKDGRGPYVVGDAQALMASSIAVGKLPIDENHATDLAAPKGGASPARGWIVELQQRDDGIWGRVEWTAAGRRIMEDREYRGVSPVIAHGKDGTVSAILRASLTNTPNLDGLTTLHSRDGKDFRSQLLEKLGLDPFQATGDTITAATIRALGTTPLAVEAIRANLPPEAKSLDAGDLEFIRKMGLDPDEYAKTKHADAVALHAAQGVASRRVIDRDGLDAADRHIIRAMGLDRLHTLRPVASSPHDL